MIQVMTREEVAEAEEACLAKARYKVGDAATNKKDVRITGQPPTIFLPGTPWKIVRYFVKWSGGRNPRPFRWVRLASHGVSVATRESNVVKQ